MSARATQTTKHLMVNGSLAYRDHLGDTLSILGGGADGAVLASEPYDDDSG